MSVPAAQVDRRTLPLAGVRVLDLTRVLAGPLCTMLLGDLGANVVKVERPLVGDDSRAWGPPFDSRGESAYYLSCNRNKLSVAADLADAGDVALIERLVADADVVVDNFLPGMLERRGLDANRMVAQHSKLVWCTITGFGASSRRLGYDFVVQAEGGWMAITGEASGDPMKSGTALADILAGKDAAIMVLAALAAIGRGTEINRRLVVSLADSARAALINVAQNVLVSGSPAGRWGNAHPNLVPYQLFRARDREIVIAVGNDRQWVACAAALGLDELAADSALATNAARVVHRQRIVAAFVQQLGMRDASEWLGVLDQAGVPCGIVKQVHEVVAEVDASALTGMPSSVGGRLRCAPPMLDEHGIAIRRHGWGVFDQG